MRDIPRNLLTLLCSFLIVGCSSSQRSDTAESTVNAPSGYLRLAHVSPQDIRFVVTELANAQGWKELERTERGTIPPIGNDKFMRATHRYKDTDGREVRVDWVYEHGQDTIVLISAAPALQERITTALGVNVMRYQQGMEFIQY